MKRKTILLSTIFSACLLSPYAANAGDFDAAVKDAEASLDNAKAMKYEWRDSRKFIKEAKALHEAGKTEQAMKLLDKATKQGKLAVAQAKAQSDVDGPHN